MLRTVGGPVRHRSRPCRPRPQSLVLEMLSRFSSWSADTTDGTDRPPHRQRFRPMSRLCVVAGSRAGLGSILEPKPRCIPITRSHAKSVTKPGTSGRVESEPVRMKLRRWLGLMALSLAWVAAGYRRACANWDLRGRHCGDRLSPAGRALGPTTAGEPSGSSHWRVIW